MSETDAPVSTVNMYFLPFNSPSISTAFGDGLVVAILASFLPRCKIFEITLLRGKYLIMTLDAWKNYALLAEVGI